MKIEKKIWPEFFRLVRSGKKTCELRLADFKCKPGDTMVLREWNPKTGKYTGKIVKKKVTSVIKTKDIRFWPKKMIEKYGLQIICIK